MHLQQRFRIFFLTSILGLVFALGVTADQDTTRGPWPDLPGGGDPFKTFFVTWTDNGSPEMFEFLRDARPDIVQVGFYGPMFHGYAYHPQSTGYPMQLPVAGEREALDRQTEINREIRQIGLRVVGHFQMCNVIGRSREPYGFPVWYEDHWDESLLGPKPTPDYRDLLQRDGQGNVLERSGYIDFQGLCISSPHARTLLKRMVRVAIEAGVDGLMANYNYRWGCVCQWCQQEFKQYLGDRYDKQALQTRFAIDDLETHHFETIPANIPGYPDPATATELHWAAMAWGAHHFKQVFDEVLIDYGRSLKPDLIVATWNHRPASHVEERAFTPLEVWHRGENYFWYSGSHGGSDLAARRAGDAWLDLLWLREMAEGKPFMVGKYEAVRIRAGLAEASALGGAGTGLYNPFKHPVGRDAMLRHHTFMHANRRLYDGAAPQADVGLVLPRQTVLARQPDAYNRFRQLGQTLAEARILFDVVLDQRISPERLDQYPALILAGAASLSDQQQADLRAYVEQGGRVLIDDQTNLPDLRDAIKNADGQPAGIGQGWGLRLPDATADETLPGALERLMHDAPVSLIDAAWTMRVAAFRQPDRRLLHLVNYNRDEEAAKQLRGPAAECPIPALDIPVVLNLASTREIKAVTLYSPDLETSRTLPFSVDAGRVSFTIPKIEVYAVIAVDLAPDGTAP